MPHLVVEASAGAVGDPNGLLEHLVDELSACETVSASAVKARFYEAQRWQMGKGAPQAFAHLEARILSGRSPELRAQIADRLVRRFCDCLGVELGSPDIAVTFELREMDAATYRK